MCPWALAYFYSPLLLYRHCKHHYSPWGSWSLLTTVGVVQDSLAVVSGIPTGLWTTLWERLTQTYIQNKKSVDSGSVGEERRWYRQRAEPPRPLGYAPSHWFWKRVKGREEEVLISHRRGRAPGGLAHFFSWSLPCYNWNCVCLCLNDNIFHRICK